MKRFGLVLPVVLLLAGCAHGSADAAAGGGLWGHTFLSTSVTDQGRPRPLVPGSRIVLGFDAGRRLTAQAGCNHLGGSVRLDGDRLVLGEVEMTEMGCDQPRLEQDSWLAAFLGADPTWRLSADALVLQDAGTSITFLDREVADPDRALAGPEWTVDTLLSGQTAGSVPAGVRASLSFTGSAGAGRVSGSSGCGQLGGDFTATAETITFGELTSTATGCAGDGNTVAAHIVRVLHGTVRYTIEADHLTLTAADGTGLRLTAG